MPLNFVLSQKSHKYLEFDGYEFIVDRKKANYTNWKCVEYKKRRCLGRCHTSEDTVKFHSENHNHPPQPDIIASKSVLAEVRKEAKKTVKTTQQIVSEMSEKVSPGVVVALPPLSNISRTIRRQRSIQFTEKSRPKSL